MYARFVLISCLLFGGSVVAQLRQPSSAEILLKLKKLKVLGSALYVAAHPDDENTRLIGYLSQEMLVNTAYLALTRGDGGQNLIGPELREGLGLIRTQELLAARRVDGSRQYFTRANDFGYSKTAAETLEIWDREQVLHDVVWVYRNFRPDVIITRFPPDARAGHGHHTSSAILAAEAFDIAGTQRFANQLPLVQPWQPKRLMINSGRWWDKNIGERKDVLKVDVGVYNAVLGESYTEIAARSRSMHKSQGFGSMSSRGAAFEYLTVAKGAPATSGIFSGIDISWGRVGHPEIGDEIAAIIANYNPAKPYLSIDALLQLKKKVAAVADDFWRQQKLNEIDELLIACSGLFAAAWAHDYAVVPDSQLAFSLELVNRSPVPWELVSYSIAGKRQPYAYTLANNRPLVVQDTIAVSPGQPVSGPYWLESPPSLGMYTVDDLSLIGTPENPPPFVVQAAFNLQGTAITLELPLQYHWRDRVNGEMVRPLTVVPPVFVNLSNPVYLFKNGSHKEIKVDVIAGRANFHGSVSLDLPQGWTSSPQAVEVTLERKWQTATVSFTVSPSAVASGEITAVVRAGGKRYSRSLQTITYDHIPYQIMLPVARSRAENLSIKVAAKTVGYIMGAGDQVPEALEQLGLKVWVMTEADITAANLSQLDVVIFGIRAANTLSWLPAKKPVFLEYMQGGGTVVMQYNTTRNINWQDFAPYPLTFTGRSADSRVAEETADITVLAPDHIVLNYPNKITGNDFAGWVQERGLYFPSAWDEHYTAILSGHDTGEEAKNGGLLIARYGQGYFVYTGYSWFRELPAGVPGAYRIFANILSLGRQQADGPAAKSKKRKTNN